MPIELGDLCETTMALATGMNTTAFGMECTKTGNNGHSCSGVQLAKQIDSCEDTARVIVTKVVDSVFGLLPWQILQERWSVK